MPSVESSPSFLARPSMSFFSVLTETVLSMSSLILARSRCERRASTYSVGGRTGGFAFRSSGHRVYFSGDTGLFPGLAEIGTRLGPFDLTLIETGAYGQAWPDWHLGPEQAVKAHGLVQGRVLLPIHWGLFNLSSHGWTEPVERVLAAARAEGVEVLVPRPGEAIEPESSQVLARWWPELPWKTASERPILATPDGLKPATLN